MGDLTNSKEASMLCGQWLNLLDELSIGAFTANSHRSIRAINYNAQALIGMREKEVIGNDCREIFTGVPCIARCIFEGDHGNTATGTDIEIIDENFERHFITRIATPIYDSSRKMVGCLTILQDHSPITDLIDRVHYEERSLKMILDNLDIGIFTVNRGGLITFFNTAAEKISGYNRKQILGKHFSILYGNDRKKDTGLLQNVMATGNPKLHRRGQIVDSGSISIPISAKYLALRNEKSVVVGGMATFQDLTLVDRLSKAINNRYTFHDMIGKDPAIQKIFERVNVVAESDATILIEGATGTGKDLLAKVIHTTSKRSQKPFIKINCAAIPENLIESEIFGYVKGAFTGADRDKPGRFQEAADGTIFLDEIGDLPLALQAKLLRVLEDREFYPLGSRKTQKVDVRIISATNRNLDKMVSAGLFRADLFYRLNVLRIELPPLKERRSDLPLLIRHILRQLCAAKNCRIPDISGQAMKILLNLDYPGNVRELENILEHALIICQNEIIQPKHLPDYTSQKLTPFEPVPNTPGSRPDEKERKKIIRSLKHHNGHRARTAAALNMDRTTLWRKMKRYHINDC